MDTGSDFERYCGLVTAYATDNTLGDVGDAMNVGSHYVRIVDQLSRMQSYLDTAHQVMSLSTSVCVLNSEINTIAGVLGGK